MVPQRLAEIQIWRASFAFLRRHALILFSDAYITHFREDFMLPDLRAALPRLRVGILVALVAIGACTLDTEVSVGPAALIKVPDGDGQTAMPSTTLPIPLSVIVVNQFGDRLAGASVNWSVESGGGTLSSSVTVTDATGTASVDYTAGATPGPVVIQASAAAGVLIVTFNVTVIVT